MDTQSIAAVQTAAIATTQDGAAQGGAQQTGEGGFLQLISQLLGSMQADGGQLLGAVAQLRRDGEKDGVQNAQMLMAQLLYGGYAVPAQLFEALGGQDSEALDGVQALTANPALTALFGGDGTAQAGQVDPFAKSSDTALTALLAAAKEPDAAPLAVQAQPTAGQPIQQAEDAPLGADRFLASVRLAKQQLTEAAQEKKQAGQTRVDVDWLQQQVDAGRFAPNSAGRAQAAARTPGEEGLMAQVRTGIAQGLTEGKEEFTVKLQPEGLGEITVKLAQVDAKLVLRIVASSEQTARLLNASLAELKESLRPLGAQVQEVGVKNDFFSAQQDNAFAGNAFYQSQQQARQQRAHQARTPDFFWEGEETPLEERPISILTGALDAYI